jgi:hypothetical protein
MSIELCITGRTSFYEHIDWIEIDGDVLSLCIEISGTIRKIVSIDYSKLIYCKVLSIRKSSLDNR